MWPPLCAGNVTTLLTAGCCRLMRRLLADLHAAGLLDTDTLEVWRYDNSDVTKDKVGTLCVCITLHFGARQLVSGLMVSRWRQSRMCRHGLTSSRRSLQSSLRTRSESEQWLFLLGLGNALGFRSVAWCHRRR